MAIVFVLLLIWCIPLSLLEDKVVVTCALVADNVMNPAVAKAGITPLLAGRSRDGGRSRNDVLPPICRKKALDIVDCIIVNIIDTIVLMSGAIPLYLSVLDCDNATITVYYLGW